MFGSSNPFGQSSSTPFGSQPVFGQSSSVNTNPFAPKPFGSPNPNPNPNPFGSQSGGSLFGGSSTGVFGQTSLSLGSAPAFGASSAPAFGSSTPAFGASSTPAFGTSTSSFGGSSAFGQKPAFGGFGSTQNQASPFGSTFQQTQPAFGSNLFGSTQFGASSQPAFGAGSTPAFGSASAPAFGSTTTPTFGATSTPPFGSSTTPAFGGTTTPTFGSTTTSLFGSTGAGFGVSSTPAFGSSVTPAFGASSTSLFGSSNTPAFGASSTPAFGSSSAPAFGSSTSPSFGFGSSPSFGQSTPTFGSTPFGSTPSPFGTQSSPFGAQTTTTPFGGSTGFGQHGGQSGGSRVAAYTPTPDADGSSGAQSGKLESVSAMPVYKDKSHEELRWEDYQRGDKGGPNPIAQPTVATSFPAQTQSNPFSSTGVFSQPSTNPFSTPSSNPFAPKPSPFAPSTIASLPTSPFISSPFSSSSPFNTTTQVFGTPTNSGFHLGSSSPSLFSGTTNNATSSAPFSSTQSSGLFQSTTPSIGQTQSIFGQQPPGFLTNSTGFGTSLFNTPANQFSGPMTSIPTASNLAGFVQAMPSLPNTFQFPAPAQTSNTFNQSNLGQTQSAFLGGFGVTPNTFNQGSFLQSASTPSNMVPITNPFGTLPAMPQMSIGRVGATPSIQYGISSMPVAEQPTPIRISSLLAPRHLSHRRMRLPAGKYHPKSDGQRVSFFADDDDGAPATPKADALFIPRENPRALFIRPIEQWPSKNSGEKQLFLNGKVSEAPSAPAYVQPSSGDRCGSPTANGHNKDDYTPPPSELTQKVANGSHTDNTQKGATDSSCITISGHRDGEEAIGYEYGADIMALLPKLHHADYYTEPQVQELAAKERANPGFCRRVKDFVVGRQGFGSIKFYGETDVRRLDLESIVEFNNREVIVYKDESKKPPVGQGLNKPAEVTLLNVRCMNKKTGQQYTEGARVEKYKEMLAKKAEEQGAEFLSYDPVKGEWRFKVKHFSRYEFGDPAVDTDVTGADLK